VESAPSVQRRFPRGHISLSLSTKSTVRLPRLAGEPGDQAARVSVRDSAVARKRSLRAGDKTSCRRAGDPALQGRAGADDFVSGIENAGHRRADLRFGTDGKARRSVRRTRGKDLERALGPPQIETGSELSLRPKFRAELLRRLFGRRVRELE
jgi:hypothetical protein